ncbi:MAG: formate dehydrogenase accessory sulfurtransferase FdhD [Methanobrevibacter sp.]|jgi:formate dehydrogenase accessory protein FdhD|nr:formate dehydrogenase accessory sulfurtransferase FdhD [Candidatus Methanovirga basalitermitum]
MKMEEVVDVIKYNNGEYSSKEETIVADETINLTINETLSRKFSISPNSLKDFAIGYILGEGLIKTIDNIEKLKIDGEQIKAKINLEDFDIRKELMVGSDCFGGWRTKIDYINQVESDFEIEPYKLIKNMKLLTDNAIIWKKTGGTHVAMIINDELDISIVREDVSRHVAVDKVIGAGAREKIDFSNSYILYSGRMPADMLIKIARVGIPLISSNAAPTLSGYTVAKEANITMVGFLRGEKFNVYTHPDRIIF